MANPGSLLLKLIIDGSSAGAVRAAGEVENSLKNLQTVAKSALQFAGIGLGISELIKLGDTYSQMSSRLKLATQYTGDFVQVQQMLRDSAFASRSGLVETVDLYTQMAPALKGIGLSAAASVGVVTTINQAISLSGASASSAQAALVQLGQGFASGALRGEELNSVMEQTPALAQAIADGLGVSRGALRKMGEDGKLTAEAVATALQKVSQQISEDFARAPVTVAQSFTALKNEVLVFVGATDQANGGTSKLAGVIMGVAEEFKNGGPAVTAFSNAITIMVNGLDGAYRMLKIVGTGLAGYAAAASLALKGDFAGAKAVWQDLGNDIDAILQKPLVGQQAAVEASANTARKRSQLELQLADEQKRLEGLKVFVATGAMDQIAGKEKANIDARIADQQRLVDAVRTAWQQQLAEAEKFAEAAKAKLSKATDFRDAGQSSAFNAGLKGLSQEDQTAAKAQRMTELQGQGSYEAARARMAAIEGDIKKYDAAAAVAEKRLKEALQLAQDIGDVASIESISNSLAGNQEAGAKLDQKKSEEAKAKAADQAKLLNDLQAQLKTMTEQARAIEVKIELGDAETKVKGLTAQLAEIKDKTVTVTVNTVNAGGAPVPADATPARAYGGPLPGIAPHDRADNMLYRGTPGEWVVQRPAVRYWGSNFMRAINEMRMPAFAYGGELGGQAASAVSRISVPSLSANVPAAGGGTPLVLDFGKMGRYQANTSKDVAAELVRVVKRTALGYGRD